MEGTPGVSCPGKKGKTLMIAFEMVCSSTPSSLSCATRSALDAPLSSAFTCSGAARKLATCSDKSVYNQ